MTRIGKIARLPHEVREQLNCRLQDGEPGAELVGWLNGLPEVQAVLAEHFAGRPLTEQNLSEWKTGGYGDWLAHQQALEALGRLEGEVDELEEALEREGRSLTEMLAQWLAVRCIMAARAWAQKDSTDPEAMRQLRGLCQEVMRLRRLDLQSRRVEVEENWLFDHQVKERREWERKRERELEWSMRLYAMGLGPKPREVEEAEKNAECGMRSAERERAEAPRRHQPSTLSSAERGVRSAECSKSKAIRSNPTKSDHAGNAEGRRSSGERGSAGASKGESRAASDHQPSTLQPSTLLRPHPTKSDLSPLAAVPAEGKEGTERT